MCVVLPTFVQQHDCADAFAKTFRGSQQARRLSNITARDRQESERLELVGNRSPTPELLPAPDGLAIDVFRLVERSGPPDRVTTVASCDKLESTIANFPVPRFCLVE